MISSVEADWFDKNLDDLEDNSIVVYSNLYHKSNSLINKFDPIENLFIIQQYSLFSKKAIHYLLEAGIRIKDWDKVYKEVLHNIEEELGLETLGVPHLEIMREAYRKELGFDPDKIKPTSATRSLLSSLWDLFSNDDNAVACGVLYAFEFHAISEFKIIKELMCSYLTEKKINYDDTIMLKEYVDGHIIFEVGHAKGLATAIAPYINKDNFSNFREGFLSLSYYLDRWWQNISSDLLDIKRKEVLDGLEIVLNNNTEKFIKERSHNA